MGQGLPKTKHVKLRFQVDRARGSYYISYVQTLVYLYGVARFIFVDTHFVCVNKALPIKCKRGRLYNITSRWIIVS